MRNFTTVTDKPGGGLAVNNNKKDMNRLNTDRFINTNTLRLCFTVHIPITFTLNDLVLFIILKAISASAHLNNETAFSIIILTKNSLNIVSCE